jgi:SAM-dependent methyltransferase
VSGGATKGLSASEDAYGQILLAVLEGRNAQEIIERDDGLIYCGDPSDYFAPYRRWPTVEKKAMRFARGRVLDVGCGGARVSLHLQERGHEVVAIDESPLAIEVAKRRGVAQAEVRSLADLDASLGIFDTILVLRNNFGLVGEERAGLRLLRRLTTLTSDRGRIITDSVDPDRHENPAFRTYRLGEKGEIKSSAQRYRVRWQQYATPWFRYLMLAPAEMERLVAGTGWRVARIIDDGSPRYGAVLEKQG